MNEGSTIEAHSLTKIYGDKAAVDGIDFQVKHGAVTGFLGPNGAGNPMPAEPGQEVRCLLRGDDVDGVADGEFRFRDQ